MIYPTEPAVELILINADKWERKVGFAGEQKDGRLSAVVIQSPTNQANVWYEWVAEDSILEVVLYHERAFTGATLPHAHWLVVEVRPVNKA